MKPGASWWKLALAASFFAIAADMARAQTSTAADAPALYREHCVACHGEQRLGVVQLGARQAGVNQQRPFKRLHGCGGAPQRQQDRTTPGMKAGVQQALRCSMVQLRQQALQFNGAARQWVLGSDLAS